MAYNLITSPEAEFDIERAVKWYVNINIELAQQFIIELKAAKIYIVNNPKKIQIRYNKTRIAFLKRFSYGIHYVFHKKTIVIVAVFNTAENPIKWKKRSR